MKYVIWFDSLIVENNSGYFFRKRKEGFTSVHSPDRARLYKTRQTAARMLARLNADEGDYYKFEIREVAV